MTPNQLQHIKQELTTIHERLRQKVQHQSHGCRLCEAVNGRHFTDCTVTRLTNLLDYINTPTNKQDTTTYQIQYTTDVGCYNEECNTLEEATTYANDIKETAGTVEIYQLTLIQDIK